MRLLAWAFLVCALGASLSLDYTDSLGLFGLTLLGLFWGFRDGFVRGLGRGERLYLAVLALVPAAALVSDELSRFTRQEFRFAGRDLRFLLAVAAYGALRRLRPRAVVLGGILAGGAVLAFATGLFEHLAGEGGRAAGATGVAIVFGDLGVLSGIAGAAGLLLGARARTRGVKALAILSLAAGLGTAVLSDSRGAFLGFLLLAPLFFASLARRSRRVRRFFASVLVVLLVGAAVLAGASFSPSLAPARRIGRIERDLGRERAYLAIPRATRRRWAFDSCFASRRGLAFYRRSVKILPPQRGDRGWILIVPPRGLPGVCRRAGAHTLLLAVPWSRDVTTFVLPTALLWTGVHRFTFWARGRFVLRTCRSCRYRRIETRRFRRFRVAGRLDRSSALLLTLRPGQQAWFVPGEHRPGEFSTAPLRNSVDERFELWRAALRMAARHPWWGVGFGGFDAAAHRLARAGRAPPFVAAYEHPHDDLLDALASGGVVGLLVALLLYGVPLVLFVRAARDADDERAAVGWMGILGVTGFLIFGTTEAMFVHSLVIGWYALYVGALVAALAAPPGDPALRTERVAPTIDG